MLTKFYWNTLKPFLCIFICGNGWKDHFWSKWSWAFINGKQVVSFVTSVFSFVGYNNIILVSLTSWQGRCLCCWLGRRWLAEKVEVKLALKSGNFRGLVGHWFWVLTRANGESSDKGKWRKCSKASQVQKVDGWCRLTSCWFVSRLISHFAREGHHTKKQHNKVDGYARVFLLSGMMQHTTSVFFCWLLF
jgi:hypothetical protein